MLAGIVRHKTGRFHLCPVILSCHYQIVIPLSPSIQNEILPTDLYTFP